jgi:hypothetical protein
MIFLAAALPVAAMVACIGLVSDDTPFCMDAHKELRICIDGQCRTPADLSRSWRHDRRKQAHDFNKLYGVKP